MAYSGVRELLKSTSLLPVIFKTLISCAGEINEEVVTK